MNQEEELPALTADIRSGDVHISASRDEPDSNRDLEFTLYMTTDNFHMIMRMSEDRVRHLIETLQVAMEGES